MSEVLHCDVRTRKMCVCARTGRCGVTPRRVHGSCCCLDAKLPNSAISVEKWYNTGYAVRVHMMISTTLTFLSTHAVSSCYLSVSSMLSYFTIGLTICRLASCVPFLPTFESMKTNSTMLGLVTSLKVMMVVGVLNYSVLQIVPPMSYSTIPGTLVAKGQLCSVDAHVLVGSR